MLSVRRGLFSIAGFAQLTFHAGYRSDGLAQMVQRNTQMPSPIRLAIPAMNMLGTAETERQLAKLKVSALMY